MVGWILPKEVRYWLGFGGWVITRVRRSLSVLARCRVRYYLGLLLRDLGSEDNLLNIQIYKLITFLVASLEGLLTMAYFLHRSDL